jgi:hypothetical protein
MEDLLNQLEHLAAQSLRGNQRELAGQVHREWLRVEPVLRNELAGLQQA